MEILSCWTVKFTKTRLQINFYSGFSAVSIEPISDIRTCSFDQWACQRTRNVLLNNFCQVIDLTEKSNPTIICCVVMTYFFHCVISLFRRLNWKKWLQVFSFRKTHQVILLTQISIIFEQKYDIALLFLPKVSNKIYSIYLMSKIITKNRLLYGKIKMIRTTTNILKQGMKCSNTAEKCQQLFYINDEKLIVENIKYSSIYRMQRSSQKLSEKFQIVKQLGSGSFGKVHLVKHKQDHKLYALKSVSLNRLNQKEKDNALNEVRLLASFDIPTVIKYEGSYYDHQKQQLCLIMEYADGGDLQQMILERVDKTQNDGFGQDFIWKITFQILQGVKVLHKNKVIHRDIKSANIFFVDQIAKLGDMNVSKLTEDGLCSTNIGTPYYTAPQIWKGLQYDSKCDIWSIGCVIYELCCLKQAFKASDFPSLFRRVLKGEYTPIPQKYSDNMKELVRMCLTSEPQMRPSASQLLQSRLFSDIKKKIENGQKFSEGEVDMIDQIKCPRVLKFLNSRLPKPRHEQKMKTVTFASKQSMEKTIISASKENHHPMRRIRSQKVIKWIDDDTIKLPKVSSKKRIKLGSDKQENSDRKIQGLTFSTKRLKLKVQSSKLLPEPQSQIL